MVESLGLRVDGLWLRVKLANMRLCAVESGYVAMSSSAGNSADRGGSAGGGVRKESTSLLWQVRGKAALRLTVNPFGSQARHSPYIAIGMATQRHCYFARLPLNLQAN